MLKKRFTALSGLVESDEEELEVLVGKPSTTAKSSAAMAPAKKSRATASNRVTKPAQTTTRPTNDSAAAATTKEPARKALAEKTSNMKEKTTQGRGKKRAAVDDLSVSEVDGQDENAPEPVDAKPRGARGRPRAAKAQKLAEVEESPVEVRPEPVKRSRKPKSRVETPPAESEIPDTQQPEAEVPETQPEELSNLSIEEDERVEELLSYNRVGPSSVQRPHPQVPFSASRRPVPASDSELHAPSMRRRLGELTRKYESLEAKYRDLREIGVKEAEHNYDRLKKQGEERASTANQLIATLKAQLSTQTELAKESQRLRQQLEASHNQVEELQSEVTEINGSLAAAKTESKALSMKLAAARSAESSNAKIPSSAIKGSSGNNRLMANAEAATQVAQMKEDLYGDLTSLTILGVKRERDEEIYDCIQTGRNGTLHFKLAIVPDESSDNHGDENVVYTPQLDANRDRDLIDMLPDYLVDEITFPRPQAGRFYSRVMKSLTERLE